jgi:hypothetical protein
MANFIIYIVACTSYHNNDLLKWVYAVHKLMHQQISIICKQNIYIKQIYYFTDSFTLKELSNMTYLERLSGESGVKRSTRHDIDDKVCAQHHSINKYMTKKTTTKSFFLYFHFSMITKCLTLY